MVPIFDSRTPKYVPPVNDTRLAALQNLPQIDLRTVRWGLPDQPTDATVVNVEKKLESKKSGGLLLALVVVALLVVLS